MRAVGVFIVFLVLVAGVLCLLFGIFYPGGFRYHVGFPLIGIGLIGISFSLMGFLDSRKAQTSSSYRGVATEQNLGYKIDEK